MDRLSEVFQSVVQLLLILTVVSVCNCELVSVNSESEGLFELIQFYLSWHWCVIK